MTDTTRLGLRRPAGADNFNLTADLQDIVDTLDDAAIDQQGTLAARPAANALARGTYYYGTDTGKLYRNTGTTWVTIGPADADDQPRLLARQVCSIPGGTVTGGSFYHPLYNGSGLVNGVGVNAVMPIKLQLSDYDLVAGRTPKLILRTMVACNDTAPGPDVNLALIKAGVPSGPNGSIGYAAYPGGVVVNEHDAIAIADNDHSFVESVETAWPSYAVDNDPVVLFAAHIQTQTHAASRLLVSWELFLKSVAD